MRSLLASGSHTLTIQGWGGYPAVIYLLFAHTLTTNRWVEKQTPVGERDGRSKLKRLLLEGSGEHFVCKNERDKIPTAFTGGLGLRCDRYLRVARTP